MTNSQIFNSENEVLANISELTVLLTDSLSCHDGRYLLMDSGLGSWNSGRGLLNVITSVRSWLETEALYIRSDLCRILRIFCSCRLSRSLSISGSCGETIAKSSYYNRSS